LAGKNVEGFHLEQERAKVKSRKRASSSSQPSYYEIQQLFYQFPASVSKISEKQGQTIYSESSVEYQ